MSRALRSDGILLVYAQMQICHPHLTVDLQFAMIVKLPVFARHDLQVLKLSTNAELSLSQ